MSTKKAILYARFSPRPNADECESCERQLEDLRAYCNQRNIEIVDEFADKALSGGDDWNDRPGMFEAEHACKRGYLFLVRDFDRLFRDTLKALVFVADLEKRGVTVTAINQSSANDESPEGKLLRTLFLAIAEYQRQISKIRTSMSMRRHQKNGRRMSDKPPYGSMIDPEDSSRLIVCDKEVETIEIITEQHQSGLSLNAIAKHLNNQGVYKRNGKPWHHEQIKRILLRSKAIT